MNSNVKTQGRVQLGFPPPPPVGLGFPHGVGVSVSNFRRVKKSFGFAAGGMNEVNVICEEMTFYHFRKCFK